jgi:hypothetical protein
MPSNSPPAVQAFADDCSFFFTTLLALMYPFLVLKLWGWASASSLNAQKIVASQGIPLLDKGPPYHLAGRPLS